MGGFFDSGLGGGGFDPTALGGIPTTDPGINVVSNPGILDQLTNFALAIGSSVNGVYNNARYGNPSGIPYPVAAQPQLAGGLSGGFLLLLLAGAAILIFRKK